MHVPLGSELRRCSMKPLRPAACQAGGKRDSPEATKQRAELEARLTLLKGKGPEDPGGHSRMICA